MLSLPVDEKLPQIVEAMVQHSAVVLSSPPGSGKTTRVPPALSSHFGGLTVLLQPRRVAVRSSAQRIADENGWVLGREVGYQIRFDKKWEKGVTKLLVVTEGVLTNWLMSSENLEELTCLILDEFHERSVHLDFALGWWLRSKNQKQRTPKLCVMSATLDLAEIEALIPKIKRIELHGKAFPLSTIHHRFPVTPQKPKEWVPRICELVKKAIADTNEQKSVLVFLPGVGEISSVRDTLKVEIPLPILILHGKQKLEEQLLALSPGTTPRVILATNVAETSLTVPGVSVVVDSGLERVMSYNYQSGAESLRLQRISKASAQQRAGRAARTEAGVCYRLWSLSDDKKMEDYLPPEIHRIDMMDWVLRVFKFCGDFNEFPWVTFPKQESFEAAINSLKILKLIDRDNHLTDLGSWVAQSGLDVRSGLVVWFAKILNNIELGAYVAAILTEPDFVLRPEELPGFSDSVSDVALRVDLLMDDIQTSRANLSIDRKTKLLKVARSYLRSAQKVRTGQDPVPSLSKNEKILFLVFRANVDRLTQRRDSHKRKGKMLGGRGVILDSGSCVAKGQLFVSLNPVDIGQKAKVESQVSMASLVKKEWLLELYPEGIKEKKWVEEQKGRGPQLKSARYFYDIMIDLPKGLPVTPELKFKSQIEFWRENLEEFYKEFDFLKQFLLRWKCAEKEYPDLEWPELSGRKILESMTLLGEIDNFDVIFSEKFVLEAVGLVVDKASVNFLDQMFPESFRFSTGRIRPIVYREGMAPIVSIKIQEVYGVNEHPAIAEGKLGLVLDLLAPNFKSAQLTSDLPMFWRSSYPEVKKELKSRYPKHSWPDDPSQASPEFKGSYPKT